MTQINISEELLQLYEQLKQSSEFNKDTSYENSLQASLAKDVVLHKVDVIQKYLVEIRSTLQDINEKEVSMLTLHNNSFKLNRDVEESQQKQKHLQKALNELLAQVKTSEELLESHKNSLSEDKKEALETYEKILIISKGIEDSLKDFGRTLQKELKEDAYVKTFLGTSQRDLNRKLNTQVDYLTEGLKTKVDVKEYLEDYSSLMDFIQTRASKAHSVSSVNNQVGDISLTRESLGIPSDESFAAQPKEDRFVKTWSGRTQEQKNKDNINLLDFGASEKNTLLSSIYETLQDAKNKHPEAKLSMTVNDLALLLYKDYLGGGGVINIPSGTFKFNSTHDLSNYDVYTTNKTTIDFTDCANSYGFRFRGSYSNSTNVINVTKREITTVDASGYSIGDWLLLTSVTRCDDKNEAGEDWVLGVGTASVSAMYFGEPVQIESISGNVITITRGLLFPKYSLVKDGVVGKVEKINFVKGSIIGKPNIILPNKYFVACDFLLPKDQTIDIKFNTTTTSGIGFLMTNGMGNKVIGLAVRPPNWQLNDEDHSRFNTWKSVSGWYNEFDVIEYNGSQSVDQTYSKVPSINEYYKVNSINPKEQGMTTHGFAYGTKLDIRVSNNITSALSNRSRFTTINLVCVGNGIETNSNNIGVSLLDYGMTDVDITLNVQHQSAGVRFNKSYSAVTTGPSVVNCSIKGIIAHCRYAYDFSRKAENVLSPVTDIKLLADTTHCRCIAYNTTDGWNNVLVEGTHTISPDATLNRAVFMGNNSFNWRIRNFKASGYPANMTCIHVPSGTNTSPFPNLSIDWDTCQFLGDGLAVDTRLYGSYGSTLVSSFFEDKVKLENFSLFRLSANTNAGRTLNINSGNTIIPYSKEFTIIVQNQDLLLNVDTAVTLIGNIDQTGKKVIKLTRIGANTYVIN